MGQIGANPVDHGHEVVTNGLHAAASEIRQTDFVAFDQLVAFGTGILDRFAHRQRLDDRPPEAERFDVPLQIADRLFGPDFTVGYFVQRGHDAFDTDLPQHVERNPVFLPNHLQVFSIIFLLKICSFSSFQKSCQRPLRLRSVYAARGHAFHRP